MLAAMLDRLGECEVVDTTSAEHRLLIATASAPLEPPHDQAFFEYAELYARKTQGWELIGYRYEFQQRPPPGRRAYHWHEPWAYHFHCLDPRSPELGDHYRGYEVDVFEAHRAFLRLSAEGEIDCSELHPLRP